MVSCLKPIYHPCVCHAPAGTRARKSIWQKGQSAATTGQAQSGPKTTLFLSPWKEEAVSWADGGGGGMTGACESRGAGASQAEAQQVSGPKLGGQHLIRNRGVMSTLAGSI